jgi:precorrin-6B methylase 2
MKMRTIQKILLKGWDDYKKDLHPKDRRMRILKDNQIFGMTTENIQFLINECVRITADSCVYLEIGTFLGSTIISAALYNSQARCISIDNFSQFRFKKNKNLAMLKENIQKFKDIRNIEFYCLDYKRAISHIFSKEPGLKVDIYFYDGNHSYKDQLKGLNIILPHLSEKCIILIDDINWPLVQAATHDFLKQHNDFKSVFKITTSVNLPIAKKGADDWWNGFEIITRNL